MGRDRTASGLVEVMELKDSYARQIESWGDELTEIGRCLDAPDHIAEFEKAVEKVRDLRCRVRQVCRELDIYYDDADPIAVLIRRVMEKTK